MIRSIVLLLGLLLSLTLAASSLAVPLLVELEIRDPLAVVAEPVAPDDGLVVGTNNGKGKENSSKSGKGNTEHGKPGEALTKGNLKSLTLWLSKDGKSWKALDAEVTG